MAQLDFLTYPSQIFWLLITFFLLWISLSYWIVPRFQRVIENRAVYCQEKYEQAKAFTEQAQALQASQSEALAKARTEAFILLKEAQDQAQTMLDQEKQRISVYTQDKIKEAGHNIQRLEQDIMVSLNAKLEAFVEEAWQVLSHKQCSIGGDLSVLSQPHGAPCSLKGTSVDNARDKDLQSKENPQKKRNSSKRYPKEEKIPLAKPRIKEKKGESPQLTTEKENLLTHGTSIDTKK